MTDVFIDGKEGTTGLQIYDRLAARPDVRILTLSEEDRKSDDARRDMLNSADISFLCLPDAEAKKAAAMTKGSRIIDASTAHRTAPGWVYGFAEMSDDRYAEIATADRVANPGCHATGFISIVAPLVRGGIVSPDYPFVATSLSGYSGAGKKTIAEYESDGRDAALKYPRHYATGQNHKHLPEMMKECGLENPPIFQPVICDFYAGMCVTVPLYGRLLNKRRNADDIREYYAEYYAGRNFVKVPGKDETPSFIAAGELAEKNILKIYVSGNDERIFVASVFDNLGKGASGAAVQNMNIMLGLDEAAYLT